MGFNNQLSWSIQYEYCNDYGAKTSNDYPKVFVENKWDPIDDDLQSDSGAEHSNNGVQVRSDSY